MATFQQLVSRSSRSLLLSRKAVALPPLCPSCSESAAVSSYHHVRAASSSTANTTGANEDVITTLRNGLKLAMRAKDSQRAQVLKSVIADIQSLQHQEKPPSQMETLLQSHSKRNEALSVYATQGGREDLCQQFEEEIKILEEYIPEDLKGLSDLEVTSAVLNAIEVLDAHGDIKQLGAVVKYVKDVYGLPAKTMGKQIAEKAKSMLQG